MKILAANWKLHKTPDESAQFCQQFLSANASQLRAEVQVVIFPQILCTAATTKACEGSAVQVGLQNAYFEKSGAFTGEASIVTAKTMGARWILVGHSERRTLFGETDDMVARKLRATQDQGLIPMLCIGETLQQRESGQTEKILQQQLQQALFQSKGPLAIAYEPVWAIGTGKVATVAQVAETHAYVRSQLMQYGFNHCGPAASADSGVGGSVTPILYGGSVKADNAAELGRVANVDGFLVGGASLEPQSFAAILSAL